MSLCSQLAQRLGLVGLLACAMGTGCTSADAPEDDASGSAVTSVQGRPLELRFSGEVVAGSREVAKKAIVAQLQYLQGALTTDAYANAQVSMPTLTNVREVEASKKTKTITYDAALTLIWPTRTVPPATYEVVLPRDLTKLDAFNRTYVGKCGRVEYGVDTFWHSFNPKSPTCKLDAGAVTRSPGSLAPHPQATTGKYPEYDLVWEDDALDVVAVYSYVGSNMPTDDGVKNRERLLAQVSGAVTDPVRTEAPKRAGVVNDSTVTGSIVVGGRKRRVTTTAILVGDVETAGPAFLERYRELTKTADVVLYNGHSGLGKNIAALADNTSATAGKYQLVYLYGCQTLGYLGPTMHEQRAALNGPSDPDGTKYLDVIANSLESYADDGASIGKLVGAMLDYEHPKTFEKLIDEIWPAHLATVFGEHDNVFVAR